MLIFLCSLLILFLISQVIYPVLPFYRRSLAQHERSFVRPSPSGRAVGGVARATSDSILLCEAAGYDMVHQMLFSALTFQSNPFLSSPSFLFVFFCGFTANLQNLSLRCQGLLAHCLLLNASSTYLFLLSTISLNSAEPFISILPQ